MSYSNPENGPAIRAHTRENPATCPWCGNGRWFVSAHDDRRDNGRVEMYCDSPDCHSRETELIVTRGDGAHTRADVRALHAIDEGRHTGDTAPPPTVDLANTKVHTVASLMNTAEHNRARRIDWRHSDALFTVEPSASDD